VDGQIRACVRREEKLSRRKDRSVILLDETKVKKRNGKIAYVSVCLDLSRREVSYPPDLLRGLSASSRP
jgi:hypothetical protein